VLVQQTIAPNLRGTSTSFFIGTMWIGVCNDK
jgi:hypothetical protein